MSRNTDGLVGFLLGVVAGATAAVLLAPDKGSETRRKIRAATLDLYGRGEEFVEGQTHAAADAAHRVADVARGKLHSAQEKVHEVSDTARSHAAALKEAVNEGRDAYRREMNKT